MQSGQAIRDAVTLEREKDMEFNTIMQALVKDIAEQLRPMVRDMVRADMIDMGPQILVATEAQLADLAGRINLEDLAGHIDVSTLAGELTDGQLNDIAGDIDLADLAGEIDPDKITANIDMDDVIRDFFRNNSFSIRP